MRVKGITVINIIKIMPIRIKITSKSKVIIERKRIISKTQIANSSNSIINTTVNNKNIFKIIINRNPNIKVSNINRNKSSINRVGLQIKRLQIMINNLIIPILTMKWLLQILLK